MPYSEEERKARSERMKARWADPAYREKMSHKARKLDLTEEERNRRAELMRENWRDPEWRAMMESIELSSEARQRISEAHRKLLEDPEYRERRKRKYFSSEERAAISGRAKQRNARLWSDEEFVEKFQRASNEATSKRLKRLWEDPVWREKMSEVRDRTNADPQVKANLINRSLGNRFRVSAPPLGVPCAYCGCEATEMDHDLPKSRGGSDDPENLVPSCVPCNTGKGNLTGDEYRRGMKQVRKKRVPGGEDGDRAITA